MKIFRFDSTDFIPSSHEDPKDPGVVKKVLFERDDLPDARVQMVNWALLPVGRSFQNHYHEDMSEVFVVVSGEAEMIADDEAIILGVGDAVLVPAGTKHKMRNTSDIPCNYLCFGVSVGGRGKTVNV